MKRIFLKALLVGVVAVSVAGCGSYTSLLKGSDYNLMYTEALKYYDAEKYQKTLTLLDMIKHIYSGTAREDSIAYYTAASYYKTGDFDMSAAYFDYFRHTYPRSPFLEDVEYMYAKGFYYQSPEPSRDQTATKQALLSINEYLERYPNSTKKESLLENVKELTQKLYDKSYLNAKSYYNTRKYKSAVVALKGAADQYPESPHREEIMYLIVKSSYLLAKNSVPALVRDRYLNTLDSYYNFISDFPESSYRKELDKIEEDTKKYLAQNADTQTTEK